MVDHLSWPTEKHTRQYFTQHECYEYAIYKKPRLDLTNKSWRGLFCLFLFVT